MIADDLTWRRADLTQVRKLLVALAAAVPLGILDAARRHPRR